MFFFFRSDESNKPAEAVEIRDDDFKGKAESGAG